MNPEINELANLSNVENNTNVGNAGNLNNDLKNTLGNFSTSTLDKDIANLEKEIAELNKWEENGNKKYYDRKEERIGEFKAKNKYNWWDYILPTGWVNIAAAEARAVDLGTRQAKADMENALRARDLKMQKLEKLKQTRTETLASLEKDQQKYIAEKAALKSVGITNPYFMVKNGVLSNGSPINLESIGTNYQSKRAQDDYSLKELLEMLNLIVGMGTSIAKVATPNKK